MRKEIDIVLTFIPSILLNKKAIFVSTPIYSGKSFMRGDLTTKYACIKERSHLIEMNRSSGNVLADLVRSDMGRDVISSSLFSIPGWTVSDYDELWCEVIRRYSDSVYFNIDWEYSNECVLHYITACEKGIPCYVRNWEPVTADSASEFIADAATARSYLKQDTDVHRDSLQMLMRFRSQCCEGRR